MIHFRTSLSIEICIIISQHLHQALLMLVFHMLSWFVTRVLCYFPSYRLPTCSMTMVYGCLLHLLHVTSCFLIVASIDFYLHTYHYFSPWFALTNEDLLHPKSRYIWNIFNLFSYCEEIVVKCCIVFLLLPLYRFIRLVIKLEKSHEIRLDLLINVVL
jgi:hypothetical protein